MNELVAFTQKDGEFTIEFENGKIKRGTPERSYALHNLFCFGRLSEDLASKEGKKLGWAGSPAFLKEFFSTAWSYYLEDDFTTSSVRNMINEFNRACDRDYKAGLTTRKVAINKVFKLDKTTMVVNLILDSGETNITIKL